MAGVAGGTEVGGSQTQLTASGGVYPRSPRIGVFLLVFSAGKDRRDEPGGSRQNAAIGQRWRLFGSDAGLNRYSRAWCFAE
jgi:hypothetical protein